MSALLEFEDFRYRYPDGTPALNGLTCAINEGETVGFVGPNGAGKTTALLSACGLLEGEGTVRVRGASLNRKTSRELGQEIGFVFQNPDDQLFMPTVYEDIAFGPKNMGYSKAETTRIVTQALHTVELEGYEHKSSHHLSTGEQKRVSLACVLAMKPDVLILDEPSSNLDPHARRQLIKLIQTMDRTTVIAGHDLEMILELCDRVVILNHGRIVADDLPEVLFRDAELMYSNLLEVPYSLKNSPK